MSALPTRLLTGLDLDRAIAEAKGWTKIFVSSVPDLRGTHRDGSGPWAIKRWHADPALALELWEEMSQPEYNGYIFGLKYLPLGHFKWVIDSGKSKHPRLEAYATTFCEAIGNVYLQWQAQQKGTG